MNPDLMEALMRRMGAAPRDVTRGPSGRGPAAGSFASIRQAMEPAAGFLPGIGDAIGAKDAVRDFRAGNYGSAALAAASTLPVVGAVGDAARAAKKVSDLPMDQASRMARAKDMGFTRDVFHGSNVPAQFDEMRPSRIGEFGPAVYTSTSANEAGTYAMNHGLNARESAAPHVLPLKARLKAPIEVASADEFWNKYGHLGKSDDDVINALKSQGHDGIVIRRPVQVWDEKAKRAVNTGEMQEHVNVFDPKNLRSRFAKFDPAQSESSNLLASLGLMAAGGAGYRASQEDRP
jgi:hypothetical protein